MQNNCDYNWNCATSVKTSLPLQMSRSSHEQIFGVLKAELSLLQMSVEAIRQGGKIQYCATDEIPFKLQTFERKLQQYTSLLTWKIAERSLLKHDISKICSESRKVRSNCGCSKCITLLKIYRQRSNDISITSRIRNCLFNLVTALRLIPVLLNSSQTDGH